MRAIIICSLIMGVIGGIIGYKIRAAPPPIVETKIETRDKIITVIKKEPGGTITKTITQDRLVLQEHNIVPLPKQYGVELYKVGAGCALSASRRVFGDLHAVVGLNSFKQLQLGIRYEF